MLFSDYAKEDPSLEDMAAEELRNYNRETRETIGFERIYCHIIKRI